MKRYTSCSFRSPGSLSYRSKTNVPLGSIVSISLRKQTVPGIVIACRSVAEAKSELKTASFALSKSALETKSKLPLPVFKAAERIAQFHAAPVGSVLAALVADVLPTELPTLSTGTAYKKYRVEGVHAKRVSTYRSRIISALEEKKATLLIVPTIAEIDVFKKEFSDFSPLILASSLSAKKRNENLELALLHTGLIIATPSFAWTPIRSLGAIIAERVSAGTYVQPRRPYLDIRRALEELATARSIPYTVGDYPLPLEERLHPENPLAAQPSAPRIILDTRSEKDRQREWEAIPKEIQEAITATTAGGAGVLLLAVRKGYAPTVVCRDCGTAVTDTRGRTLSFTKVRGKNVFRSSDGVETLSTDTTCVHCGSWNLYPLGVGVERVFDEAKKLFPTHHILHFDAATPPQARKLLKLITPTTIVVGTEYMLPWITPTSSFGLAAIISADSLLSLPFWRARERFVRIGLMLAERAKRVIVATRKPEDTALEAIADPTTTTFFSEETALRKVLLYPPFGTLIHFSAEGRPEQLTATVALLTERLQQSLSVLPFQLSKPGIQHMSAVLHVKDTSWPNETLSEQIRSLPPSIRVRIDTESLW
ncbi:hypothetical protein KKH81_00295 [Patescibacteria group bacterium]|nr:hypothetical protein [Patescibacteria group bacterium]